MALLLPYIHLGHFFQEVPGVLYLLGLLVVRAVRVDLRGSLSKYPKDATDRFVMKWLARESM